MNWRQDFLYTSPDGQEKAVSQYPDIAWFKIVRAKIYFETLEYDKADSILKQALDASVLYEVEQLEILYLLAQIHKNMMNLKTAKDYASQTVNLLEKLGDVYILENKYQNWYIILNEILNSN